MRAGGEVPKQWQMLAGRPVLSMRWTPFAGVWTAGRGDPTDDRARAAALVGDALLVDGGATRDASVRNALEALAGSGVTAS